MAADVCDFGGSWCARPTRIYPATSFAFRSPIDGGDHTSVGAWFACPECAALIDAGEWDTLRRQSVAGVTASIPMHLSASMVRTLVAHCRLMHDGYRAHATGPGRAITPTDQADADAIQEELRD